MKTITYVGTSDIRSFGTSDEVGVELEFHRHVAQEVKNQIADLLLGDERFAGEFIEGEYIAPEPVTPDGIDDSQAPLDGL